MKITLLTVGKLKEKFWKDACAEYEKRLSAYTKINSIVVEDGNDKLILDKIPKDIDTFTIAMCIEAKQVSSEDLAAKIETLQNSGKSHIIFLVGGSSGLTQKVKEACDLCVSMGPITLPHNLARVVLTEQIYRAFTIINGKTYHK